MSGSILFVGHSVVMGRFAYHLRLSWASSFYFLYIGQEPTRSIKQRLGVELFIWCLILGCRRWSTELKFFPEASPPIIQGPIGRAN